MKMKEIKKAGAFFLSFAMILGMMPAVTKPLEVQAVNIEPGAAYWSDVEGIETVEISAGSSDVFKTNAADPTYATITTGTASGVTKTGATLEGTYIAGTKDVTEIGFKYWKDSASETVTTKTVSAAETISATISGLAPNTAYSFKVYVIEDGAERSGATSNFTTISATYTITADKGTTTESPVDFGTKNAGYGAIESQTVTITNTGNTAVTLD